jgi:hypothetical protein
MASISGRFHTETPNLSPCCVQEMKDVPANQILTLTEPPRLSPQGVGALTEETRMNPAPCLAAASVQIEPIQLLRRNRGEVPVPDLHRSRSPGGWQSRVAHLPAPG